MTNENVKKAKVDVKKRMAISWKAAANLKDDAKAAVEEKVESIFGVNAGIVWEALNINGSMTIDDLVKATALNPEEIYGALGWLGRENKISLETRGVVRFFSLRL